MQKGWLDEAFRRDGIKFEFAGFRGGAPMVGQALANNQIDFAWQGDLLSVIGRSAGMNTRLVLPFSKLLNAYLAVPPNSPIHTIADLRGKRVAYFKGNQIHLQVLRILAANGLSEKDIQSVNLDAGTALTALVSGDIDATFGGADLLSAQDKGIARIAYSTRGHPELTSYNGLIARQDFIARYPDITQRFIDVLVRAARYASDPANRQEVTPILAGFFGPGNFAADYSDRPWEDRLSPRLDSFLVAHYQQTEDELAALGLLRGPRFDVRQWIDSSFVDRSVAAQGLQNYWPVLDSQGRASRR
ncbi:sulfonate transport system substrate-binding protein [Paraburkholderia sp. JPY465]|uniref:ABC transporter substrate-binding protein n=1 Tax=Paraburkholderia sp. JPY465 TaxID=3042285 RepID=UPI003D18FFBC